MSRARRRFSDRGKITRTLTLTDFDITYFDKETKEIKTIHISLVGKLSEKEMLASISDYGIGLEVTNVNVTEALYVCDIEDFLSVAVKVVDNKNLKED